VISSARGAVPRGFATLADAIAAAEDRDVVEVRSVAVVSTPPIRISGKALTIRAADGFQPVIELRRDLVDTKVPLRDDSPLVLEGLELRHVSKVEQYIVLTRAPIRSACRFVLN
jgi:hypothetical protein